MAEPHIARLTSACQHDHATQMLELLSHTHRSLNSAYSLLACRVRLYVSKSAKPRTLQALRCLMQRERGDSDATNPLPYLPLEIWERIAQQGSTLHLNQDGQLSIDTCPYRGNQETVILEHGRYAQQLFSESKGLPQRMLREAVPEEKAARTIQRAFRQFRREKAATTIPRAFRQSRR